MMAEQIHPTSEQTTRIRCKACHRTALLYSALGIHIRCHRCKADEVVLWTEVLRMYERTQEKC